MIILEVKFKTFLNSDAFKNMAQPPAPAPPKLEDRDSVPKNDQEPTPEEIQKMNENLQEEKFEELPDPMGPAQ